MKAKSTTRIAFFFIGMAMLVAACEPKPNTPSPKGLKNKSEVEKMLDKLIDSLHKETDWSKAKLMFGRIESSIESEDLDLRDKVKEDFHATAKDAYCYSMDNIMSAMMSGDCGKHKILDEIWKLRTGADFRGVQSDLHKQVEQLHKVHEEMRSFINQTNGNRQNVTSFDVPYDEQYEASQKSKAKTYLNSKPTCKDIKSGLESIQNGSVFNGRRKDYCQKVVDSYLAKDAWNQGDENVVKGSIKFYTKDHSGDAKVEEWMSAIKEFKNSHQ